MRQRVGYSEQTTWSIAVLLISLIGLSACNSSSDNSPANDDPDISPTMPGDLTFAVYSSHEIELFWTASADDGWILGYDIFRNDVRIEDQLDANSFFDTDLEPATTYQYRVAAVDDEGNRSVPSEVELTTLNGPLLPAAVTEDNHVELLRHVFDIYTGNAYRETVLSLPRWPIPTFQTTQVPDVIANIREFNNTYICSNGGAVEFEYTFGKSLVHSKIFRISR